MFCFNCCKKVEAVRKKITREYNVDGNLIYNDEYVYVCPICEEELREEDVDGSIKSVYEKYLNKSTEPLNNFKELRTSLNLSQELFSKALGWSKKSINRYETGETVPQKEYLVVYKKLFANKDEIINILNYNKKELGETYYKILKKISTNINIKMINAFLYMLENNPLYYTKIVLSLLTSDFVCQKELKKPLTNLKYINGKDSIDFENDELINLLIQNNYIKIYSFEDDKVKFIAKEKCDLKIFNPKEIEIMKDIKSKFKKKTIEELNGWIIDCIGMIKEKNN